MTESKHDCVQDVHQRRTGFKLKESAIEQTRNFDMLDDAMNVAICSSWLGDPPRRVQDIHQIETEFKPEETAVEQMWKVVTVEAGWISEVEVKTSKSSKVQ